MFTAAQPISTAIIYQCTSCILMEIHVLHKLQSIALTAQEV